MKLSEKLKVVAEWLSSEDNELLAEATDTQLDTLALSLVHASETLREVAEEISITETPAPSTITPDNLAELAAIAAEFDASGDEMLQRQASVLDEILHTLAAPKDYVFNFKKAEDAKLDVLKKKYHVPNEELAENIGVKEAVEAINDSPMYQKHKVTRPLEASLSARTCFDHPGAQLARIGEGEWQCSLDHKIYNYETGFTDLKGDKIGGGSVSEQTPKYHDESHQLFDSRAQRLGIEHS